MMAYSDSRRGDDVIETASATTSPDNASSGPAAYVIAGVTLAVVVAASLVAGAWVAGALASVASDYRGGGRSLVVDDDYLDDYFDYDDFDDLFEEMERFERYPFGR